MLRLLSYLLARGTSTVKQIPERLDEAAVGLPVVSGQCVEDCVQCLEVCPTQAIHLEPDTSSSIAIDLGSCIGCMECMKSCPGKVITSNRSTKTWSYSRSGLLKAIQNNPVTGSSLFSKSLSVRVVSTGCTACDLELSAANNPIFDMERFGINIVASPRFADALVVTGPVPKSMHGPLKSCFEAMAEPRLVIACGTCAISGGVHAGGYAEANGVSSVLPVDLFIPGCPPHPWQIINGLLAARVLQGR